MLRLDEIQAEGGSKVTTSGSPRDIPTTGEFTHNAEWEVTKKVPGPYARR